ncbi:MAG: endonuclease/exonuclease/phosphatase family protein [Verrucomicrobiota bacterium]
MTLGYFLLSGLILAIIRYRGETNWLFSAALFLPSQFWLVPLLVLAPLHLWLRPRLVIVTFIFSFALYFFYLDFCWSVSQDRGEPGLTVLTNNIGDRRLRTMVPFMKKEQPDIVALQDIWSGGGVDLQKEFPDRFRSVLGEYALISRFAIRKSQYIQPAAVRFEVDWRGTLVAIYSVHMPSPRHEFSNLRGRGLVREWFRGGGIYSKGPRNSYAQFVEQKAKMSRELIEVLRKEKLPFLVVGDFNMPSNGKTANWFGASFADAFREKGRGHGNTFPGWSENRGASIFGPWLRLDYLFAGKDWETVMCRVEPSVPAQHLAVVARFKLRVHKP